MQKGSTRRAMPSAYGHKQKTGLNGERLCRWCERPVKPPRRTYCSDECVHEWRLRSDPGYLRHQVYERDGGICSVCKIDTGEAFLVVRKARKQAQRDVPWGQWDAIDQRVSELLVEAGLRPELPPGHRKTLWDADHIVPVVEGGGECDLGNIRTLCWWCHRDATAALRRRMAGIPEVEQLQLFGREA